MPHTCVPPDNSASNGLGLAPGQAVGIIAGIAAGVALIAICLLVGMMLCRRWFYKRSRSRAYLSDLSHSTARGQVGGQEVLEQIAFNTDGERMATTTDKGVMLMAFVSQVVPPPPPPPPKKCLVHEYINIRLKIS